MSPSPGIEPMRHWWGASALTAAPSLIPLNSCTLRCCVALANHRQAAIKRFSRRPRRPPRRVLLMVI